MFSKLGFTNDLQISLMHCISKDWRSSALKLITGNEKISEKLPRARFEIDNGEKISEYDYLICGAFDFFSENLKNFLSEKINCEFIEVDFVNEKNIVRPEKFFLVHFLDNIDAIDLEKSDFDEYPAAAGGGISKIRKLVLDDSLIQGKPAFVLNEISVTIFSDDLCKELVIAGFRGLKFTPLSKYQFG